MYLQLRLRDHHFRVRRGWRILRECGHLQMGRISGQRLHDHGDRCRCVRNLQVRRSRLHQHWLRYCRRQCEQLGSRVLCTRRRRWPRPRRTRQEPESKINYLQFIHYILKIILNTVTFNLMLVRSTGTHVGSHDHLHFH